MNLKLIDAAIASYQDKIDDADKERLSFFRDLWEVQARCAEKADVEAYAAPDAEALADAKFAFEVAPVEIDAALFAETFEALARAMVDSGYYPDEVAEGLAAIDWQDVAHTSDLALLGSDPARGLIVAAEALEMKGMPEGAARLAAIVVAMALKPQLEDPAARAMKVRETAHLADEHPLFCPVCGTAPALAHVGGKTSSAGRGRVLVCPQCGTAWEFERVRCARCGTHNQTHLHFFNLEGDDAHRIATCEECGGYIRTLYSEDALAPCSYEVEDVVMAKLDAVAQDPRIAAGKMEERA